MRRLPPKSLSLGVRPCPHGDVEKKQGHQQDGEMQVLLCQAAGTTELRSKTHVEAKSLQVQRVQECTACIQVRHRKAKAMGRYFDALLSAVWELRLGQQDKGADNDMQSVLGNEACGRLQCYETKSEKL